MTPATGIIDLAASIALALMVWPRPNAAILGTPRALTLGLPYLDLRNDKVQWEARRIGNDEEIGVRRSELCEGTGRSRVERASTTDAECRLQVAGQQARRASG